MSAPIKSLELWDNLSVTLLTKNLTLFCHEFVIFSLNYLYLCHHSYSKVRQISYTINGWFGPDRRGEMNRLIKNIKSIFFRLKWIFMSPRHRYACLWAKTKKPGDLGFNVLNISVSK